MPTPDDAIVQVDIEALGRGGIVGALDVVDRDSTLIDADGIERHKAVGTLDHTRDIGLADHKAHHARAARGKDGKVNLAELF